MTSITVLLSIIFISGVYTQYQGATRGRRFDQKNNELGEHSTHYNTGKYHSFVEQMEFLELMAILKPSLVSVGVLGESREGREIKYVKIGYPSNYTKPTLLIDAGFHAREWIGPAVALWTIEELTSSNKYENLLRKIDIIIIPNMNPDGYEYTRDASGKHRLHRKNMRTPLFNSSCYGVDLNRNFPMKFGGNGTSPDECSLVYRGEFPLSEPESHSLVTYMEKNIDILKGYLSLHSHAGLWLYPYAYAMNTYPSDVQDLIDVGNEAATAIASVRRKQYRVANSADALRYASAGCSQDFAYSLGIKYSYTVEINSIEGKIDFGFEMPDAFIVTQAKEVFQGILVVAAGIAE